MAVHSLAHRVLPFLSWGRQVDRATLRADAIAGLIGAIVVLPQGVAYATLAGLPPEYGLYCAMVPVVVAALFGSSLHAMSGPTNAVSLMVLSALAPLAAPGSPQYIAMSLTLALLSGLLMLSMGVLRIGALVNFVSNGVIIGFTAAIGLIIIASQIAPLAGIHLGPMHGFVEMLHVTFNHAAEWRPWALLVGVVTVLAGAFAKRLIPRLAPMLVATIAGTVAASAVNAAIGAGASGIQTLGALPSALPPLSWPDFSRETLHSLGAPVLAVTILSVTQAVAIVRAIAIRSGQRIDTNQELIGQGLSNIAGAFFSGYPSCASVNRCGINYESGARTPISAVLSAVFLVLLLFVLAPVAALLPLPAIAGLLVLAGWGLLDFEQMRMYLRTSRQEAGVLAITLLATLFIPLAVAILVGVMASLVIYLYRTSRPMMRSLAPDPRHSERRLAQTRDHIPECPQLKILAIEGSIYFGAVNHVETHFDTLRARARDQKHLMIVARNINFVDVAGAEALVREAGKRAAGGGRMYIQGARQPVEQVLRRGHFLDRIGEQNVFRSKRDAIAAIFDRLDRDVCARCRARVFTECASLPPPQG